MELSSIQQTQKKRGRPRKIINNEQNLDKQESNDSNDLNVKKTRGRPRKYDPENAKKLSDASYRKSEKYRLRVFNYTNPAYPLTKLDDIGKHQCNICKSLISSAKDYRHHVKSQKHIRSLGILEELKNNS